MTRLTKGYATKTNTEQTSGVKRYKSETIDHAKHFLTETIDPLERTHRAALMSNLLINQLTLKLRQRTKETSIATRNLLRGIAQRKATQTTLKKSRKLSVRLLQKSSRLQRHLQRLTRKIMLAHERARHKMSLRLHDEIAQTLLAINLRLLLLKNVASANTESLMKEIAKTEQLVRKSGKMVNEYAYE